MSKTQIIGVDFSGAKSDQNTWLAQGRLEGTILRLEQCRSVGRRDLTDLLAAQTGPVVAALDFPFGVPEAFVQHWAPESKTMPDLWAAAAEMDMVDFIARRNAFVARCGEPKRQGDLRYPECYSPLHQVNPNMVPMTFHGMRMLHRLWPGWQVPPLEAHGSPDKVLLEAMPGAALKALGLLSYKGYKSGMHARDKRQTILAGLEGRSGVKLPDLPNFMDRLLDNHDALDAVVAAVTAALWALDPTVFRRPCPAGSGQMAASRLEGWLYAPVPASGRRQAPGPGGGSDRVTTPGGCPPPRQGLS